MLYNSFRVLGVDNTTYVKVFNALHGIELQGMVKFMTVDSHAGHRPYDYYYSLFQCTNVRSLFLNLRS